MAENQTHLALTYKDNKICVFLNGELLETREGENTFEIWLPPAYELRLSDIVREIKAPEKKP